MGCLEIDDEPKVKILKKFHGSENNYLPFYDQYQNVIKYQIKILLFGFYSILKMYKKEFSELLST